MVDEQCKATLGWVNRCGGFVGRQVEVDVKYAVTCSETVHDKNRVAIFRWAKGEELAALQVVENRDGPGR